MAVLQKDNGAGFVEYLRMGVSSTSKLKHSRDFNERWRNLFLPLVEYLERRSAIQGKRECRRPGKNQKSRDSRDNTKAIIEMANISQ